MSDLEVLILVFNEATIPDCVLTDNKKLKYIDFYGTQFDTIDAQLLILPHLESLSVVQTPLIDVMSFGNNINGTLDVELEWKTDVNYRFFGTSVCDSFLSTQKIELPDGEYVDWTDVHQTYYSSEYRFLNATNACDTECKWDDSSYMFCRYEYVGNGICDDVCDSTLCYFDKQDCNQLCACNYTLLSNGECDLECNTTECDFDREECLYTTIECSEYKNSSYEECKMNYGCQSDWIGDAICDQLCDECECVYDDGDCQSCNDASPCLLFWVIFAQISNFIDANYLLSEAEVCLGFAQGQSIDYFQTFQNCSHVMRIIDSNGDQQLSANETFTVWWFYEYYNENKLAQLNCSICITQSMDVWYNGL
jgi:hypothetical protein